MKGKKLLAGVLSAAMVLGTMVMPAFADDSNGVEYNGTTYATLEEARAAVVDTDTEITYTIHGKVTMPAGYIVNLTGSAANASTVNFVAAENDTTAELALATAGANLIGLDMNGSVKTVNYTNLTLSRTNGSYIGDIGHSNNYFTTALRNAGTDGLVTYTGCTFPNGSCNNLYGKTQYKKCNFKNDSEYGLWVYGGETEVSDSNFTGAKGAKIYSENANADVNTTIKDSTFDSITKKPAIVSSTKGTVTLENIKTINCVNGLLQTEPKDGRSDLPLANVTVDGKAPAYVAKVGNSLYTDKAYAQKEADKDGKVAEIIVATNIALQFISTSDANVYDIVLSGNGQDINRLNTADFTFGIDNNKIGYTIAAAEGMTLLNPDNANRYEFHFNGKTAAADTAATIKIGTVTFEGYGAFKFNVQDAATNLVTATTKDDNLVTEFVVNAQAGQGTLVLNDEDNNGVIDTELTVPTKKLTINITFPNAVASNAADYQQMKVAIAGGDYSEEIALGAMENGAYKIEKDLAENTAYTVTVSGAGYRTARYTVMLNADKTLNFWNNVKDAAAEVEESNTASAKNVTFLAGDIVKDNVINIYDLSAVVSYFGTDNLVTDHPEYAKYDLNRDGKIDSKDVAYVLVSWGK